MAHLLGVADEYLGELDPGSFYIEEADSHVQSPYLVANGCTKVVFRLPGIDDYIFKMPLWGEADSSYDENTKDYEISDKRDYSGANDGLEAADEDLAMWPANHGLEDYCATEAALSLQAERDGVSQMVCPTTFLGRIASGPVYVSPRCETDFEDIDNMSFSRQSQTDAREVTSSFGGYCGIDSTNGAIFVEAYGKEALKRLLGFVSHREIGDLHRGNMMCSYDGTSPKIVDMAGYHG